MTPAADSAEHSTIARVGRNTHEGTQRERVPVLIFDDPAQIAYQVAHHVATLIQSRNDLGKAVVLGLPTGSSPIVMALRGTFSSPKKSLAASLRSVWVLRCFCSFTQTHKYTNPLTLFANDPCC